VPQTPKERNLNNVNKYICIVSCNSEKLGKQIQIKIQKLMSNLVGIVKSTNSTKAGNLIVECNDNQQYKTLLKSPHLSEWVIKVYVPKSMSTSIGCIYNVPLDITEEDIKDVLKQQNVSNCVRLTYYNKEIKERQPSTPVKLYFNVPELPVRISLGFRMHKTKILYPNLFNVSIGNSLVTCNQTVASPESVINVASSMKTKNVLSINPNAQTVKEYSLLIVKLVPKK
jgi:hypothetical protein